MAHVTTNGTANGTTKKSKSGAAEAAAMVAAAEAPQKGGIPKIDVRELLVPVRGITTLIMNKFSEKAVRQMAEAQQKTARLKKAPKNPEECYQNARYLDDQGRDCVPVGALRGAIISAGRFVDGLPMTKIKGAVFFVDDLIPIECEKVVMREDHVRNGGPNGVADLRYRPEYHGWRLKLRIQFNANVITRNELLNLIQAAGFSVGIGEWRPEKCAGQHGRFDIDGTSVHEVLA